MKKDFFRLQEHGTTAKREVLAGITTFMTMAYVLAVQPAAICGFGPDPVFTDVNRPCHQQICAACHVRARQRSDYPLYGALCKSSACPFHGDGQQLHSRRSRKQRRVFLRLGPWRFFSARAYCLFW